jgi:hypothetical protein
MGPEMSEFERAAAEEDLSAARACWCITLRIAAGQDCLSRARQSGNEASAIGSLRAWSRQAGVVRKATSPVDQTPQRVLRRS